MPIHPNLLKFIPQKRARSGEFRNCQHCGKSFYLQPFRVARNEQFCSKPCEIASKRISKVCPVCHKTFEVSKSTADRYTVCSRECRLALTRYVNCKRCGKRFANPPSESRSYCSEACRRPPMIRNCKTCGTPIRVEPKDTDHQFCSFSCYRKSQAETLLEQSIRLALNDFGISFEQEARIGRYSVDFLIISQRIAIEVDGDYWHQDARRDARKDAFLHNHGFHVVRIRESTVHQMGAHAALTAAIAIPHR